MKKIKKTNKRLAKSTEIPLKNENPTKNIQQNEHARMGLIPVDSSAMLLALSLTDLKRIYLPITKGEKYNSPKIDFTIESKELTFDTKENSIHLGNAIPPKAYPQMIFLKRKGA